LQIPENDPTQAMAVEAPEQLRTAVGPVAPWWHTALLILGILAISIIGRTQLTANRSTPNRLLTYGTTASMEAIMLGWVAFGLWLRKVRFPSLFGTMTRGFRSFALDVGVALVFWIGALMILGTLGLVWTRIEAATTQTQVPGRARRLIEPSPSQQQTLQGLERLAPTNGMEIGCWALLCCFAGFVEEAVFRGYLQQQFIAWTQGRVVVGIAISALIFGAAHGYQGIRNMALLAVFGALFGVLAIVRRSLRAGIFAHSWHDLIAGLVLAFLRSHHLR
jgi:membrane protease YdiL (CAAX protease family)